jgi:hemoglobin
VETTAALLQCDGDAEKALSLLAGGWKPQPIATAPVDAPRCPFGFGAGNPSKGAGVTHHHAEHARELGNAQQAKLDELLQENADFCCPITMVLFNSPVLASDGCVYEKDAIAQKIASGKLSPMTHEKLGKELFPVPEFKNKVIKYMDERVVQLLDFAKGQTKGDKISLTLANTALDRTKEYIACLPSDEYSKHCREYAKICQDIARPISADILAEVNPQGWMKVNIRTMAGKVISQQVNPTATIKDVLDNVRATVGADMQGKDACLNLEGERLAALRTLADYKVDDQSLLHLVLVPMPTPMSKGNGYSTANGTNGANGHGGYASKEAAVAAVKAKSQAHVRAHGQAGTLYARCGGIFGIAGFVDRCMDAWMSDPTLNANTAVATWHAAAQRCGFKFLVTQLMGYLSGGPQVYTGRDMATSHKHLNINSVEWTSFMECLQEVCMEFQLPQQDVDDLTAVILSMMDDCIVTDGETAPPNPGHGRPDGNSLYAQLGGVYPIALFADRLVDAMLGDERIKIPMDGVKRSAASLKYLFTEIICNITGGPEVVTAPELEEAMLGMSSSEFFYLLAALENAADHVEDARVKSDLKERVYDHDALICDPKRCKRLDEVCPFSKDPSVRTHREMKEALDKMSRETRTGRALYVPGSGVAFIEPSNTNPAKKARLAELGFGGPVQRSSVKTSDAAARGGGERGA